MGYYDVAQICLNGHVITESANRYPEFRKKHCKKCGEETLMTCPQCNAPIQGEYHVEGVVDLTTRTWPAPAFCHECGCPYPWTSRRIQAAKDLAEDFDELSPDDREKLKATLDELYRESPATDVAASRFKRIMARVGLDSYESMKSIVTDLLSDTIRKTIFGS